MSFSLNTGTPLLVLPTQTKIVAQALFPANAVSTEGWVLAKAGMNNDGPSLIRLVDEYGQGLSDYVETNSSSVSRLKLQNVNVRGDGTFPKVVRVELVNKSTTEQSNAAVYDVLLVLQ